MMHAHLHSVYKSCLAKFWTELKSNFKLSKDSYFAVGYTVLVVTILYIHIFSGIMVFPNVSGTSRNLILPLAAFSALTFYCTQGTDPGYLSSKVLEDPALNFLPPRTRQERALNDACMECTKCGILVPIRSHHCVHCNKCVATYDHHCSLIGTCIGERNHCRFWWLLFAHFSLILYDIKLISKSERNARNGENVFFIIVENMSSMIRCVEYRQYHT